MERYDSAIAKHYAAYRPPLHELILDRLINPSESFNLGLDIGCGAGCSTIALSKYCYFVLGIDSSQHMLDLARSHPKISYRQGTIESLINSNTRAYDIVTLAGSLFYMKTETLRNALQTVCAPGGTIIVYDFNVAIDQLANLAELSNPSLDSNYDHDAGLSNWEEFETTTDGFDRISFPASPEETAHLILSDSFLYDAAQHQFNCQDPFEKISIKIAEAGNTIDLEAKIWLKRYHFTHEFQNARQDCL